MNELRKALSIESPEITPLEESYKDLFFEEQRVFDVNISGYRKIISPKDLKNTFFMNERQKKNVAATRKQIANILDRKDKRMLLISGPCSIHDFDAAIEYIDKQAKVAYEFKDKILLIMRLYFEKPRTKIGWKGLINDPDLDESNDMEKGLTLARKIVLYAASKGVAVATEFLEPFTLQYISDCVSWGAIGARTIESPTHRQMTSGLCMPIGFKNSTNGSYADAINAIVAARSKHTFLGANVSNEVCLVDTEGNKYGHLILRGGKNGINYDEDSISKAQSLMKKENLIPNIIVDCSHDHSRPSPKKDKDPNFQRKVLEKVIEQRIMGNNNIIGLMIESNLVEGKQKYNGNHSDLVYGQSITDACCSFEDTVEMMRYVAEKI